MIQNQKAIFSETRNFLAGRAVGATRDSALLDEVMKVLFIRKHMLLNGGPPDKKPEAGVAKAFQAYFSHVADYFPGHKNIALEAPAIKFVNDQLRQVDILNPTADPVGDLYETFVGSAIRGAEGQFFTPQNAGRWLVDAVTPSSGDRVIDPACGAGGFLLWAAQKAGKGLKLVGVEKDEFLAGLARSRIALLGVPATVHCANSLSFESGDKKFHGEELIGQFDVVLTNPPFGKNIVSVAPKVQRLFDLGHKWKRGTAGKLQRTEQLANKAPPQILFLERIISLLKPGGRAGVVLPESLLSNRSYAHAVEYLRARTSIQAIVGMPEVLFKTSGKGGTHTKTALLVFEKGRAQKRIFMAEAKWCGNDSRGKVTEKDDLPTIADDFQRFMAKKKLSFGYAVEPAALTTGVLSPRYYEPAALLATHHLRKTHRLVTIGDLVNDGLLSVTTGDEVGKVAYGGGAIPFVRTSDISGWEIKIDPKHCVSDDIYKGLKSKQDVRRGDVLMVRDGTYLIGSCAFVTEYDERIVYQSHILKFRCPKPEGLSSQLLIALLSSEPVQRQIKAKTFTQDIIDSLGTRYLELVLPIPRSAKLREKVEQLVSKVIFDRVEARELTRHAKSLVAPAK